MVTPDPAVNAHVRRALDHAIAYQGEIGIQVAAYLGDELVVDCWAGLADRDTGRPVDGDTLFNVFSVTKAVAATAIHVQAEKGLLDYDRPIADYWPAFGCHGKETITVRDALTHHTGVPQMPAGIDATALCDWEAMVEAIARLRPILPRGKPAYQALSFGWILGELVRRSDPAHRDFGTFVRQEIAEPFGIADLWIGIPDAVEARIATLIDEQSSASFPDESYFARALPNTVRLIPEVYDRPDVRRACIAATGGIFTARSEAKFWAILANGGALDGRRLLSPERVAAACVRRPGDEPDPVYFDAPMTLSRGGYCMHAPDSQITCPAVGDRTICVPGAGGSLGWADPDTRLVVAFCHNRMLRPRRCEDPSADRHSARHQGSVVAGLTTASSMPTDRFASGGDGFPPIEDVTSVSISHWSQLGS